MEMVAAEAVPAEIAAEAVPMEIAVRFRNVVDE